MKRYSHHLNQCSAYRASIWRAKASIWALVALGFNVLNSAHSLVISRAGDSIHNALSVNGLSIKWSLTACGWADRAGAVRGATAADAAGGEIPPAPPPSPPRG